MPFIEDMFTLICLKQFRGKAKIFSDSILQNVSRSLSNISCDNGTEVKGCQDESAAFVLKIVGIAAILTTSACGVAIPLVGKNRRFVQTDSNLFVIVKAFAAGVILATGFVHILPEATGALTNPCLPEIPWSKFPFSGFITMMAALGTSLADFLGTQYYERKQASDSVGVPEPRSILVESHESAQKVFAEEEDGAMHIVEIHDHAAHRRHNRDPEPTHIHSHSHGFSDRDEEGSARQIVVAQVLELGIVSHSVFIGLSLGVSQSLCTIRTLVATLSFHQFFEGFALGGCISQAQFRTLQSTLMAFFFAITTPSGIALGHGISKTYNPNSPRALAIEGILDSISSRILIYMPLVDLIAADFMSKRMSCNVRLQVISYLALFLGAVMMSSLATWA